MKLHTEQVEEATVNCGAIPIEGSDERTRKMKPPHPPRQDRHPGIQQLADFVQTLRGIPSPGSVAAQPHPQQTTLLVADPFPLPALSSPASSPLLHPAVLG